MLLYFTDFSDIALQFTVLCFTMFYEFVFQCLCFVQWFFNGFTLLSNGVFNFSMASHGFPMAYSINSDYKKGPQDGSKMAPKWVANRRRR